MPITVILKRHPDFDWNKCLGCPNENNPISQIFLRWENTPILVEYDGDIADFECGTKHTWRVVDESLLKNIHQTKLGKITPLCCEHMLQLD